MVEFEAASIRVQMIISQGVTVDEPVNSLRFIQFVSATGSELTAHTLTWKLGEG